jgi:hypothetical protein
VTTAKVVLDAYLECSRRRAWGDESTVAVMNSLLAAKHVVAGYGPESVFGVVDLGLRPGSSPNAVESALDRSGRPATC